MFVAVLAGIVVALLLLAVTYDLVARRRGRYLPASHWESVRRRRKVHFQRARDERRGGGTAGRDRR